MIFPSPTNSPVKRGNYINAKIPKCDKLTIPDPGELEEIGPWPDFGRPKFFLDIPLRDPNPYPYDESFDINKISSKEKTFYFDRDFKQKEIAIELGILSPEGEVLRVDRAGNYRKFESLEDRIKERMT